MRKIIVLVLLVALLSLELQAKKAKTKSKKGKPASKKKTLSKNREAKPLKRVNRIQTPGKYGIGSSQERQRIQAWILIGDICAIVAVISFVFYKLTRLIDFRQLFKEKIKELMPDT